MLTYYLQDKKAKGTMFLSNILIYLCMIIQCLQAFNTEEKIKRYTKESYKINGEQMMKIPKKG